MSVLRTYNELFRYAPMPSGIVHPKSISILYCVALSVLVKEMGVVLSPTLKGSFWYSAQPL